MTKFGIIELSEKLEVATGVDAKSIESVLRAIPEVVVAELTQQYVANLEAVKADESIIENPRIELRGIGVFELGVLQEAKRKLFDVKTKEFVVRLLPKRARVHFKASKKLSKSANEALKL
jgi:nucleoid DNA-binding protein